MANVYSLDLELSSSQYASISDASQTGLQVQDFTFEAWIKLEQLPSTPATHFTIVSKYDYTNTDREWLVQLRSDNTIRIYYSGDGTNTTFVASTSAIVKTGDVGTWVHLAGSVDVSAKTGQFYRYGKTVATNAGSGTETSVKNGASPFVIGANDEGRADYFDGKIKEVRMWDDIRTDSEILANYGKNLVGNEAGLVGYWKLENDYLDVTSNNNDLTASGSPVFATDVPYDNGCYYIEASSGQSMLSNVSTSPFQGCWVGERNDQSGSVRRSMLIFDYAQIEAGITIDSSTLKMWAQTDTSSNARTASVYRIKRVMVLNENCWDNYSTGNAWQTAGGTGANDYDSTASGTRAYTATETLNAWKDFTLTTTHVEEQIPSGSFANSGTGYYLVKMATETDDAYDHDGHDETNPPRIIIQYTPITESPSPSLSPSASPSPSSSESPSPSLSPSASASPSSSPSLSESRSPSASASPSSSPSLSPSLSPSASESRSISATGSESSSPSSSISLSPSFSPSPSSSESLSPSLSPSVSPSLSPSPSPSSTESFSPSETPSASPSLSPSASESPSPSTSVSASISPSQEPGTGLYSKEALTNLPTDSEDLAIIYGAEDEVDVSTDNAVRVPQAGSTNYIAHQFKKENNTNRDSIKVLVNLQSTLAPSESPVYLQIYNNSTLAWETIDTDNATEANTDFDLTTTITSNVENYYDSNYITAFRVYQEL